MDFNDISCSFDHNIVRLMGRIRQKKGIFFWAVGGKLMLTETYYDT